MANSVYDTATINLIDGTELYLTPLKIRYLRDFMKEFELVKAAQDNEEAMHGVVKCATIAMRQYYPQIKTQEELEDICDMSMVYKILEIAAGIKINAEEQESSLSSQANESGASWDELDLVKLESEVFLLGIWKDYEDLETSLSMPELSSILTAKRESDYQEKKFFAAIQGVDLDSQNQPQETENAWERLKARVFSNGQASSSSDIVSLQGINAQKAGFGIGMGLDYESL
jgi:hypothetical protein